MPMLLGAHIPAAGGVSLVPGRAAELGCNTAQFFSRSPQSWRSRALDLSQAAGFRKARAQNGIAPVFIHISYLINLASADKKLFLSSVEAFVEDMRDAEALGADYIVSHMGCHKGAGENAGLARFAYALNTIIKKTAGSSVGILLENSAGSGSCLGYDFSHQRRVLEALQDTGRVGICFDTAHAFASGYDLSTASGLSELLKKINDQTGMDKLRLVHLNDSRSPCGSRVDAHEHIGKGRIGLAGMRRIVNHPFLKDLPFILETPKDGGRADAVNLSTVRELRGR
ncbi:MAG: deoxyribonuclease IV [Candidatus Omnitrophota bacterium]